MSVSTISTAAALELDAPEDVDGPLDAKDEAELEDLDELDTTDDLDELDITAELDELDTAGELEAALELTALDLTLEAIRELADELIELLNFELELELELATELLLLMRLEAALDLILEFAADEIALDELSFTDVLALLNDELESGIGVGPVPIALELLALEVFEAATDDDLILLTALSFADELITADEFDKLEVFAILDEVIVTVEDFAVELTAGLLPVLLPFPPPPPPHALSEATVITAPKNAIFVFANM